MTHDFSHRTLSRKFVLQRRIGVGGMATVYEATNLQVDKRVAVKVLNPEFVSHETLLIRFRQEARSAARMSHPNIVQIHDYDVDGELPYIVMEHLEGCSLSELLHQSPEPIPWRRVADLCAQVCAALEYAHSRHVLHRDIKPSNVFLLADPECAEDRIKLLDFGIAKVHQLEPHDPNPLTRPSQVPGTPEYMAPEQAQGNPCDPRTDIYALGVMMYRLLTGRLPFYAATPIETLAQHVMRAPMSLRALAPELDIPVELEAIVLRALAKLPQQRWNSAQVLRDALLALLDDPQAKRARTSPHRTRTLPTMGTRALDSMVTPGWTTLHAFEWRDKLLRRRRLAAAFSGISLGLGAFMFFSLFSLPFVAAIAGAPETVPPAPHVRREPPAEPPPLIPYSPEPVPVAAGLIPPPPSVPDSDVVDEPEPPEAQFPASAPTNIAPPPTARTRAPDPRRLIEGSLKRRRASFRECSEMVPFGESVTLRVDLTLEPTTGRALSAKVNGELKSKRYVVCAVNVLRSLKYPHYVGSGELADIEVKL